MGMRDREFSKHFWANIDVRGPHDCWLWKRSVTIWGYGQTHYFDECGKVRGIGAHRAAYILTNGAVPDGMCVCHRCDNRICCNPAHLFLGTKGDNNRDRAAKGRTSRKTGFYLRRQRGEANTKAKLTEAQVLRIRELRTSSGYTHAALARMFGISEPQVFNIVHGKQWRHLHATIQVKI